MSDPIIRRWVVVVVVVTVGFVALLLLLLLLETPVTIRRLAIVREKNNIDMV
jgi:hypothetical protein